MKKRKIGKHVTSSCKLWLKNVARLGSLFVLRFYMKIALNSLRSQNVLMGGTKRKGYCVVR